LVDLSYMSRFWTQVMGPCRAVALRKADMLLLRSCPLHSSRRAELPEGDGTRTRWRMPSANERRCTVRCTHNAPASQEVQLISMWGGMTAESAHAVLAKPDVVVTNQSDKGTQLPKLLRLDRMMAESMQQL
jgi:hypothetical protein